MKLHPLIRTGLGIATVVAAVTVWVAIGDRHWAAALVLGALALGCAYPAITGRDLFDSRHRRRRHRRHRSKRSAAASGLPAEAPARSPQWRDDELRT